MKEVCPYLWYKRPEHGEGTEHKVPSPTLERVLEAVRLLEGVATSEVAYVIEDGVGRGSFRITMGGGEGGRFYPVIDLRGRNHFLKREAPVAEAQSNSPDDEVPGVTIGGGWGEISCEAICSLEEAETIIGYFYHHHAPDPQFVWQVQKDFYRVLHDLMDGTREVGDLSEEELKLKNGMDEGLLQYLAVESRTEQVRQLIDRGCPVDDANSCGTTALMDCSLLGSVESVRLLLLAGADPNKMGELGDAPVHLAAQNGHLEVLDLLVAHGGNLSLPNSLGETPRQFLNIDEKIKGN